MRLFLIMMLLTSAVMLSCKSSDDDPTPQTAEVQPVEEIENNNTQDNPPNNDPVMAQKFFITVSGKTITAVFADNTSAKALYEALKSAPITYTAQDYGNFEKVGDLGKSFPKNDEPIDTEPGDIILYQGHNLCIYYDNNSWTFTRIGKIENLSQTELKEFLNAGGGSVEVTLAVE